VKVEEFVAQARRATGERIAEFDAFAFGDSPGTADELAALVVSGRKRATTSLLAEYEAEGEPLPRVGQYSVVLDGRGEPAALIRTSEVTVRAFRGVDEAFARDEGEGDRSLGYWREAHERFFSRMLPHFSEDSPVVCERFELVYAPG
jgi:uncharacterized protein YhfF